MDLKLQGNKALITGASKGIGAAIGERLAKEGCDLVIAARTAADLENEATRLRTDTGRRVEVEAVDLSDGDQVIALAHGDVDILINNAGALPGGHVLDIDEATWRKAWDLKVFGYINMCREFYRSFKARGRGTIINVIGIGAVMKYPWYMCGAGGNAAVAAFTNALGGESHKDGIRVLGVSPGPVATERARQVLAQGGVVGSGQDMVQNAFGREWASPEQIADVVAFLASGRASYVSGTVVNVDLGASRA
jgi:3-oxoacyl-[acyl-carrier protein] reductase